MRNSFQIEDLRLVAERIRRMLRSEGIGSDVFIRDVTTLVELVEQVDAIIVKEDTE